MIMVIFQGWYKDGTDGTCDYRPLSALYMLIRLAFAATHYVLLEPSEFRLFMFVAGMLQVFLGMMFLIIKPYKIKWMSHTDGVFLILFGIFLLLYTYIFQYSIVYLVAIILGLSIILSIGLYIAWRCLK